VIGSHKSGPNEREEISEDLIDWSKLVCAEL